MDTLEAIAQMGAFEDSRVFAVAPNDPRLASYEATPLSLAVRHEQAHNGPGYLVIGPAANDKQLARAARRFCLPLPELTALRDRQSH